MVWSAVILIPSDLVVFFQFEYILKNNDILAWDEGGYQGVYLPLFISIICQQAKTTTCNHVVYKQKKLLHVGLLMFLLVKCENTRQ